MKRTITSMAAAAVWRLLCALIAFCAAMLLASPAAADSPQWVGNGRYRILVRVDARDIGDRTSDEMPARIHIDGRQVQVQAGATGRIDVTSLQVAQYDPESGQPLPYAKWHYARQNWEVPHRWYDDSIPEAFPEVLGNLDTRTGKLSFTPQHNWGYFHETLGEWEGGILAWVHTQRGNEPSHYAIYFDVLPAGAEPDDVPRAGFVGDGAERIEEKADTTHGLLMGRVDATDWNGDGLLDLLVGCERGGMICYPNRGTKAAPSFPYPKLMFTDDGKPLDVGFNSAPLAIDWDGDSVRDLVSGAYPDRVVWFRNAGTNAEPTLDYKGLILADGAPLSLPHTPVPESEGIYTVDYFPTLAAADCDDDGDSDLLAGGYVTGMIYLFENTGHGPDGLPALKPRGPLEADGKPIDTQWCAAPAVGDIDADGDLDLVSGAMSMTEGGGDSASSANFLNLFVNVGRRSQPRFAARPFPIKGEFPVSSLAAPRLVDLNNDGLLDLVVARTTDLSIYYNVGTKTAPQWEYSPPLPAKWRTAPLWGWATQLIDWNGDSRFDIVHGFSVRLNENQANPKFFGPSQTFTGPESIFHKSPSGDQWTFTHVADMDADGKRDILYGVHEGWVYLHRNLTSGDAVKFDTEGVRLNTKDGKPIKVGPVPGQKLDFDVLQGARTTLAAADFDRDDKLDLIVGDNYGVMRYYRNLSGGADPTFDMPRVIAKFAMRLVPSIADWNEDGWPDVLVGSSRPYIVLNSGKPNGLRFGPAQLINPPGHAAGPGVVLEQIPGSAEWRIAHSAEGPGLYLPYESVVNAADWNDDGDIDLLALASYGYLCWFERSFLQHGYASAEMQELETR
jgi:FG-GAP-like repeat